MPLKLRRLLLLVLIALSFTSCVVALGRRSKRGGGGRHVVEEPTAPALCDAAPVRVACLGDSLTRGDGTHEKPPPTKRNMANRGNYPLELATLLGDGFEVRNFGRGGATACNRSDVPYVKTPHFRSALRFLSAAVPSSRLAILMLGTNDAKEQHWEQPHCGGAAAYRGGLAELLARLPAPTPVLVLQPPAVLFDHWGISQRLLPPVRAALADAVPAAASCAAGGRRLAAPLPIAATRELITSDGIHLSRSGTSLLACAAHEALAAFCGADCALLTRPPGSAAREARARCVESLARARSDGQGGVGLSALSETSISIG